MILRGICFLVGLALIAATAHVTILSHGGYDQPHAFLTMGIAGGVAAGALAIGKAWSERRGAVMLWILLGMLAGEGYGLFVTADRLVTSREANQAPLRAAAAAYHSARTQVEAALQALAAVPTSSPRLADALAKQEAANKAVSDQAAAIGCRVNCAQLLQAQVDAAKAEVAAARAELDVVREAAQRKVQEAQVRASAIVMPASPTPFADRIGWSPWKLDLLFAALGSMAANGLGCGLLAFAAHRKTPAPTKPAGKPAESAELVPAEPTQAMLEKPSTPGRVGAFLVERLTTDYGTEVDPRSAYPIYQAWSRARGEIPVVADEFAERLATHCESAGLEVRADGDGRLYVRDAVVLEQPLQEGSLA